MTSPNCAYEAPEQVLRESLPFWSAYIWSLLLDTNAPVTAAQADHLAAMAIEDYTASCLDTSGAKPDSSTPDPTA